MRLRRHLLVIAAYLVLTLVFTYPLITQFSTHVIGGGKLDNYEYVWKMWWIPHALTSGIDPFFIPTIYYPYGYSLAYGEITPAHTFLMLPITLALGEVVAYNLAVIGSTVLTGWVTFALARRWLSRLTDAPDERLVTLAAFFTGAAFTFCVSRQLKLTGHLPLFDTQWLALALLGFDLWLERRSLRAAFVTAIALSLAALSSWYFAFMLALLLPVYLLAYDVNWRQFFTDRRSWAALGVVAIVVGITNVPFLIPYLRLNTEGETFVPVDSAAFWAASPTDYVMPNPLHPLWGSVVSRVIWPFPSPMITEFVISIGLVVLLLGMYGARVTKGRHWRALKWMIVVAFVLSLGPYLYLSRLSLNIPLPDLLLRQILPGADSIRSWGRFSLIVTLGVCRLLAGALLVASTQDRALGVAPLAACDRRRRHRVDAVRGVERSCPHRPGRAAPGRPVAGAAAGRRADHGIPAERGAERSRGMYYTRFHGKPVTYGYGRTSPSPVPAAPPRPADVPIGRGARPACDVGRALRPGHDQHAGIREFHDGGRGSAAAPAPHNHARRRFSVRVATSAQLDLLRCRCSRRNRRDPDPAGCCLPQGRRRLARRLVRCIVALRLGQLPSDNGRRGNDRRAGRRRDEKPDGRGRTERNQLTVDVQFAPGVVDAIPERVHAVDHLAQSRAGRRSRLQVAERYSHSRDARRADLPCCGCRSPAVAPPQPAAERWSASASG
ncbi:MAG: hypothetical protein U0703_29015 [Anaerolineae bacterium]